MRETDTNGQLQLQTSKENTDRNGRKGFQNQVARHMCETHTTNLLKRRTRVFSQSRAGFLCDEATDISLLRKHVHACESVSVLNHLLQSQWVLNELLMTTSAPVAHSRLHLTMHFTVPFSFHHQLLNDRSPAPSKTIVSQRTVWVADSNQRWKHLNTNEQNGTFLWQQKHRSLSQ